MYYLHFYEGLYNGYLHFYEGSNNGYLHFYEGSNNGHLHFYEGSNNGYLHFYEGSNSSLHLYEVSNINGKKMRPIILDNVSTNSEKG